MQEPKSSPSLTAAPVGAAEGEVINQNVYGAVRTLAEQGASKKAIARQLGLDVKTVRKWMKRSWAPERRRARGRLLDRWREFLQARAPEVGFNAVVLTREMAALGYRGGYSAVLKYIAPWRRGWRRCASRPVPVSRRRWTGDRRRCIWANGGSGCTCSRWSSASAGGSSPG